MEEPTFSSFWALIRGFVREEWALPTFGSYNRKTSFLFSWLVLLVLLILVYFLCSILLLVFFKLFQLRVSSKAPALIEFSVFLKLFQLRVSSKFSGALIEFSYFLFKLLVFFRLFQSRVSSIEFSDS